MKNHNIFALDALNDHVLKHGETAQARAQIVASPPNIRIPGKQVKALRDGINETIRPVDVAALLRDVTPNAISESAPGARR